MSLRRRWLLLRFRPRFFLRTLGIVVTLACVYFGPCWQATDQWGAVVRPDYHRRFDGVKSVYGREDIDAYSPMPFVVARRVTEFELRAGPPASNTGRNYTEYDFWFFGLTLTLLELHGPDDMEDWLSI
jgi:hypothetical protein